MIASQVIAKKISSYVSLPLAWTSGGRRVQVGPVEVPGIAFISASFSRCETDKTVKSGIDHKVVSKSPVRHLTDSGFSSDASLDDNLSTSSLESEGGVVDTTNAIALTPLKHSQPLLPQHSSHSFCSYISRFDFNELFLDTKDLMAKLEEKNYNHDPALSKKTNRLCDEDKNIIVIRINGIPCSVTIGESLQKGEIKLNPIHQSAIGLSTHDAVPNKVTAQALKERPPEAAATTVALSLPEGAPPLNIDEDMLRTVGMNVFHNVPIVPGLEYTGNFIISNSDPYASPYSASPPPRLLTLRMMANSRGDKHSEENAVFFLGKHLVFTAESEQKITFEREQTPSLERAKMSKQTCYSGKNCVLIHPELYGCLSDGSGREATLVTVDNEYYFATSKKVGNVDDGNWVDKNELDTVYYPRNFGRQFEKVVCIKAAEHTQLPTAGSIKVRVNREENRIHDDDNWSEQQIERMIRESLEFLPATTGRGFNIFYPSNENRPAYGDLPLRGEILAVSGKDGDHGQQPALPYLVKIETRIELEINDSSIVAPSTPRDPSDWPARVVRYVGGADIAVECIKSELLDCWLSYSRHNTLVENASRGCVIYGSPGTGKSRLVQTVIDEWVVSDYIQRRNVMSLNGADLLKGKPEDNVAAIKKLFQSAKRDYETKGQKAPLHVLHIEEAEGLFRAKSDPKSTHTSETAVNSFLTYLDGENRLPNFMVFATTNHIDVVESAILRPGRLGLQVAMSLPVGTEREIILGIHLGRLSKTGWDTGNCNLYNISHQTGGMSGAALGHLVGKAILIATQDNPACRTLKTEHLEKALFNQGKSKSFRRIALEKFPLKYGKGQHCFTAAQKNTIRKITQLANAALDRRLNMVVFLHGKPGMGKSAVMQEVIRTVGGYDYFGAASEKTPAQLPINLRAQLSTAASSNRSCVSLDGLEPFLKYEENTAYDPKPSEVVSLWRNNCARAMSTNFLMISTVSDKETFKDNIGWEGMQVHMALPGELQTDEMSPILEQHYGVTDRALQEAIIKSLTHSRNLTLTQFHEMVSFGLDQDTQQWDGDLLESVSFYQPAASLISTMYQ